MNPKIINELFADGDEERYQQLCIWGSGKIYVRLDNDEALWPGAGEEDVRYTKRVLEIWFEIVRRDFDEPRTGFKLAVLEKDTPEKGMLRVYTMPNDITLAENNLQKILESIMKETTHFDVDSVQGRSVLDFVPGSSNLWFI